MKFSSSLQVIVMGSILLPLAAQFLLRTEPSRRFFLHGLLAMLASKPFPKKMGRAFPTPCIVQLAFRPP
jgi:hypothetical protein